MAPGGPTGGMVDLPPPPGDLLDGAALFLDFDGTLVELAETPDAIRVPEHLPSLVERLQRRLEGRLAIVSGRAVSDLERHLPSAGIAVSGSHGLELRLADGSQVPLSAPASIADIRPHLAAFAAQDERLLIEDKPAGIAIHYRRAPEREAEAVALAEEIARHAGLAVQRGHKVVELRPHGADKGDAVRALMMEPAFAGARPVFVGDDLTDENGFAAAAAAGGAGVLVGPPRETAAAYRLAGIAETYAWLEAAAA